MILRKLNRNWALPAKQFSGQARLRVTATLMLCMLAACAPIAPRPMTTGIETVQSAREAELAGHPDWSFTGRLAVSQGSNGGSARIQWQQNGADFDIRLSAPITGQSWRLRRTAGTATLDGMAGGSHRGNDAEALLFDATGWRIPLAAMTAWIRGARAAGPADLSFDAQGLPAALTQDGWAVEYRGWFAQSPALPAKVFARKADASVRLVVETWAGQ